jgi:phosphoribosyl 1,2-cyclic phosphate phosphodiesterase
MIKVTILGSGPSSGIPMVGDDWGDCDPAEPRNRRRRSSILVENTETKLLFDSSPDCREQLLDAGVKRLDAIVYTHSHADHTHGIDDLRWINFAMNAPLAAYGDANTMEILNDRFAYVFKPLRPPDPGEPVRYYKPVLLPHEISGEFSIGDLSLKPFQQEHGFSNTLGFRIGEFGYSTDVVDLEEASFAVLEGIDTWLLGVFRRTPHPTHVDLRRALDWIERVKPRRTILTHMGPDMDYRTLCDELPDGVEPGYDGMVFEVAGTHISTSSLEDLA